MNHPPRTTRTIERDVARHYGGNDMAATILDTLAAAGIDRAALQPSDLARFEELHIGGREATEHLVGKLYLTPGHEVLDVGCGIGGSARYIAAHCGCRVTGLDLTPEFIHSAKTLTAAVGLEQRVRFDIGSALEMPYEDARFDAVVTQHVAMNIADRATLYREMARVLKPGRPLAIFDVMKKSDGELLFPVPWAESPDTSHLVTPQEMDALLADASLQVIESEDQTPLAIRYFRKVLEQTARQARIHPAPHLAMRQSDEKLRNTLTNIERGVIAPVMMLAVRLGG